MFFKFARFSATERYKTLEFTINFKFFENILQISTKDKNTVKTRVSRLKKIRKWVQKRVQNQKKKTFPCHPPSATQYKPQEKESKKMKNPRFFFIFVGRALAGGFCAQVRSGLFFNVLFWKRAQRPIKNNSFYFFYPKNISFQGSAIRMMTPLPPPARADFVPRAWARENDIIGNPFSFRIPLFISFFILTWVQDSHFHCFFQLFCLTILGSKFGSKNGWLSSEKKYLLVFKQN